MSSRSRLFLFLALMIAAVPGLAQDALDGLLSRVGETVDLAKDPQLREQLYDLGLVKRGQASVKVTDQIIDDVIAVRRYQQRPLFQSGDRVFVQTSGELHYRAEIQKVNADGSYEVLVWDRLKVIQEPDHARQPTINKDTGELTVYDKTLVEITDPKTGQKAQEWKLEPWKERSNARVMTIKHDELARVNDSANRPKGEAYDLNGYRVDLTRNAKGEINDPILNERVELGQRQVDQAIQSGKLNLRLSADESTRAQQIAQITKAQREIIRQVWSDNNMSYLRGDWAEAQWAAMHKDQAVHDANGRLLVSGVLKYKVGVCSDQTAAIVSVMREVGRRAGFDVRAVSGMTHDGGGHAFLVVRLADGTRYIMDPSWHAVTNHTAWAALEPIDFATFDGRHWSNRHMNRFTEESIPTRFFAAGSPEGQARLRGYDDTLVEKVMLARTRAALGDKLARATDVELRAAAEKVLTAGASATADASGKRFVYGGDAQKLAERIARSARGTEMVVLDRGADPFATFRRGDGTVNWASYREAAKRQAAGLASFTLALFLKELAVVVQTGDSERIGEFFDQLATTDFYARYGLFTAGAYGANQAYGATLQKVVRPQFVSGVLKAQASLAAGMLVAQLPEIMDGRFDGQAYVIDVASLGLSSAAVKAGLATVAAARQIGPVGRAAASVYRGAKLSSVPGWIWQGAELALILYLGDEIDQKLTRFLDDRAARKALTEASENFLKLAQDPATDPAALAQATAEMQETFRAYRDYLYLPLQVAQQRFQDRLAKLGRDLAAAEAGRARAGQLPPSLRAADQARYDEQIAKVRAELDTLLKAFEAQRRAKLEEIYGQNRREGEFADGPSLRSPSANRLQTYEDEQQLLALALKRIGPAQTRSTFSAQGGSVGHATVSRPGVPEKREVLLAAMKRVQLIRDADQAVYRAAASDQPQAQELSALGAIKKLQGTSGR